MVEDWIKPPARNNTARLAAVVTAEESRVVDMLADAWNAFVGLPVEHPDDIDSFRKGIHDLQGLVLKRAGRRAYNSSIAHRGSKAAE